MLARDTIRHLGEGVAIVVAGLERLFTIRAAVGHRAGLIAYAVNRQICRRINRKHPRHGTGILGVDGVDRRVCHRRTHDHGMGKVRQSHIADVASGSGNKPIVLDASLIVCIGAHLTSLHPPHDRALLMPRCGPHFSVGQR